MESEFAELIGEPSGGLNHGRRASENPNVEGRHLSLDSDSAQVAEFLRGGGWTFITRGAGERGVGGEWQRSGGSTHRGVLHPDEYVDTAALQVMVEHELGFTYAEVRSVYRQGRLSDAQRELRGRIDARLFSLSLSGANMTALGRVLGLKLNRGGDGREFCPVIQGALRRAKEENR